MARVAQQGAGTEHVPLRVRVESKGAIVERVTKERAVAKHIAPRQVERLGREAPYDMSGVHGLERGSAKVRTVRAGTRTVVYQ